MPMKSVQLHLGDGRYIPISLAKHDGTILIECAEPQALLEYLATGQDLSSIPANAYLCGALIPGEGAFFELRDPFGLLVRDLGSLDEAATRAQLLDALW